MPDGVPDPHMGMALRCAKPDDGGRATASIATWVTRVPARFPTAPVRSTDEMAALAEAGRHRENGRRDLLVRCPRYGRRCGSDRAVRAVATMALLILDNRVHPYDRIRLIGASDPIVLNFTQFFRSHDHGLSSSLR